MTDMPLISNDALDLTPHIPSAGRLLEFDFPALHVGVAEYAEGPTGCTVLFFPDGAMCACDVRGGWAGSFPLGCHGAGSSTMCGAGLDSSGGESAGQGGGFRQSGPTKIAVFIVVNAIGALVDRQWRVVRGHLDRETGVRYHLDECIGLPAAPPALTPPIQRATRRSRRSSPTSGWNRRCSPIWPARRTHPWRAIQPFHTGLDGDNLFAVTTNEVDNSALPPTALGVLAWDAVLACCDDD
jgi:L-aminopeptidase/D-esterase-like protein